MAEEKKEEVLDKVLTITGPLIKMYKELKYGGYVIAMGSTILIITWLASIKTSSGTSEFLGMTFDVSFSEEMLFAILGTILIIIGGLFLGMRYILAYKTATKEFEFREALSKLPRPQSNDPE